MSIDTTPRDYFEDLYEQGRRAVDRGDLDHAMDVFSRALDWAKEHGDTADVDRVSCSRLALLLHKGRSPSEAETAIRSLRMILMRSANPLTQYMSAYNISYYYELREDFGKSRFYADLALDHAKRTDSAYYLATCHSHLGNLLVRESHFPEALENYERAWELYDEDELYKRLAVLTSMGFCHLACQRFDRGFEHLFTVRRSYLRLRLGPSIATGRLRLAMCFGHLELERFHQSILHGKAAKRIGEECGDQDVVKKALYLLGEAEKLRGDEMKAFTYFANLQEDFYPDNPHLPEILLYNDTNKLVNVWA